MDPRCRGCVLARALTHAPACVVHWDRETSRLLHVGVTGLASKPAGLQVRAPVDIPGQTGWPDTCAVALSLLFAGRGWSLESALLWGFHSSSTRSCPELGDSQHVGDRC